jgi:hypothetical protein
LCFKEHVTRMAKKFKQAIGALCRTIRAPRTVFGELYKTTIEPMVTYSLESWYPYQVTLQNKIERIKKFAVKLVTNNFINAYI